jgi:hypothetical protein
MPDSERAVGAIGLSFCVREWAAWAPGLRRRDDWLAWALAPRLPAGDDNPDLPGVPALQRRRLSRLGRAAVQVAVEAQRGRADIPMVFASRYGDVDRALTAIDALEDGEPLSPTVFAGTVHNAVGAMHSILGQHCQNLVCVAAGAANAAAGLVEAAGLLADGASEVLLACYDEPLPPSYTVFADAPEALYAWAWVVAAPTGGTPALRLTRALAPAPARPAGLPPDLEVLQWLLGDQPQLDQQDGALAWRWSRDA